MLCLISLINVWNRLSVAVELPGDYILPGMERPEARP
jgi:hypothetical protein